MVLAASGGRPGERLTYQRAALYATQGDERRAFAELVAFLWGGVGDEGRGGMASPPLTACPSDAVYLVRGDSERPPLFQHSGDAAAEVLRDHAIGRGPEQRHRRRGPEH